MDELQSGGVEKNGWVIRVQGLSGRISKENKKKLDRVILMF